METKNQSGGVNIDGSPEVEVGHDLIGRDEINNVNTTNIEGGPIARYAIIGIVLVAVVAIAALAFVLVSQFRPAPPQIASSDVAASKTPIPTGIVASNVKTSAPSPTPARAATPIPGKTTQVNAALPPTYTPVPTQPPLPEAVNISSNEGTSEEPRIVFDGQGVLHVVWSDNSLRRTGDLFHRQLAPGGQWSNTDTLTSDAAGFFDSYMQLLRNPAGQACAIWRFQSGANGIVIRCREKDNWLARISLGSAAGGYSFAFSLDGQPRDVAGGRGSADVYFQGQKLSSELDYSTFPIFVVDKAGGYHVLWVRSSSPYRLEYRYSQDQGKSWKDIERLSTDENSPFGTGEEDLVADSAGNVHLAWLGAGGGLFYRRWSPNAGWSEPVTLTQPGSGLGNFPRLAVSANGVVHIALGSRITGVYYVRQGSDGMWSPVRTISKTGSEHRITVDKDETAHIVWAQDKDIFYAAVK